MGKQTIVTVQPTLNQPRRENVPRETRSLLDVMWRDLAAPINQKSTFNDWQNDGTDQLVISTMRKGGWFWVVGDGVQANLFKAITFPSPLFTSIYGVNLTPVSAKDSKPDSILDGNIPYPAPLVAGVSPGSWTIEGKFLTGVTFAVMLTDGSPIPPAIYVSFSYEIIGNSQ